MGSILISEYSSGVPVLSCGNSRSLISLKGSNFAANGHIFLPDVPENITLTPSLHTGKSISSGAGSFVGFDSKESKDRHVIDEGGCPPGLVLIDDGWQSISHDEDPITEEGMNATVAGEQMPCRLLKFQENYKFRDYVSPKSLAIGSKEKGMEAFIKNLKEEFLKEEFTSVDSVYVWHAFCRYWGGLRPNVPGLPLAQDVKPVLSPGLEMKMKDLVVDKILSTGVGLVPPEIADQMYEGLHSHLEIVLVNKKLTISDIASCLAYPTGNLRAIQMLRGRNAINFNARDPTGRVWKFKLCTRNHGRYKKPVVRGDWLKYVRAKGLTVNDFIILTMVEDAENRATYNIRVEPSLKLAI